MASESATAESLIREAEDFELIPPDAKLTNAVFAVRFADSPLPRAVELVLPNTLRLEQPDDAQGIEHWLLKRGFAASEHGFRLAVFALLAFINACAPAMDNDEDPPDDDADHIALHLQYLPTAGVPP